MDVFLFNKRNKALQCLNSEIHVEVGEYSSFTTTDKVLFSFVIRYFKYFILISLFYIHLSDLSDI